MPHSPQPEKFRYVVGNIALCAMYFAKMPTAKAISELGRFRTAGQPRLE